ncbi:MAG: NAD-dependent epimerase/dehydratase family protein [bacterium]|nr:NAD-dependent epimerase/dehydratase family protein [bacterium]
MELKDKKILVTGAGGFIGSHLVDALMKKGADVKALVHYNSSNNWGWLEHHHRGMDARYVGSDSHYTGKANRHVGKERSGTLEVICGDVRDKYFVSQVTAGVDVVFNLAALIAIPYSYIAPDSYVETNLKGALNVCQASLEHKVQRVIQMSTSEVYGTAMYIPIDEKHPMQPQSPYSASKIGADSMALSFYHTFDLPIVIARAFNTYGPRQSARAVIPTLIMQMAAGQNEIKLGNLSPTRDFNYVNDTVNGLLLLAQCDKAIGETVNIGSNTEISIKDLAELIKKIMGAENTRIIQDEARFRPGKSEVFQLKCDNSKLKTLTGFESQYSLEKGLKETADWLKKNLEKFKINLYNV